MSMNTKPNSDSAIAADVMAELLFDPQITKSDIFTKVDKGHVTLSGITDTYATKWEADHAAFRVSGVRSVDNLIVVNPKLLGLPTDTELKASVLAALSQEVALPASRVQVSVFDGAVTLSGSVDWFYQRTAAEKATSSVRGIKSVNSHILITPPTVSPAVISQDIQNALIRSARIDSQHIAVKVSGSSVTLTGNVRTWLERNEAANAAWRAKGVATVINDIDIEA